MQTGLAVISADVQTTPSASYTSVTRRMERIGRGFLSRKNHKNVMCARAGCIIAWVQAIANYCRKLHVTRAPLPGESLEYVLLIWTFPLLLQQKRQHAKH